MVSMSADPQHLSEPGPKSASQAEQGNNAGSPWNRGVVPPPAADGIAAASTRTEGLFVGFLAAMISGGLGSRGLLLGEVAVDALTGDVPAA